MTAPITVAGLCEGYGGIFLALQRLLPVQHTWYAENDPAASAVLAAHWPDAPNHDDITRIDWSSTTQPEILTAGWPCQPFSGAGKQLGTADDRHLWPYVADAVTTLRPQLFIGENVQGLLTIEHGQVFGKVLADLDVAGYRVSWTTVGACKVGACHHRHRVFIAAARVDVRAPYSDPIAHRNGDAWLPAQTPLFGDHEALKWPQAGYTAGGAAWELPADVCGAAGTMLPTPTATPYGNNQSPSAGAAVRPSLDGVVRMLPTPRATDTGTPGRRCSEGFRPPLSQVLLAAASEARGVGVLLPTPRASDTTKAGPNQRGSSGDWSLPATAQHERFGGYASAVARQESAFGLPVPDPTGPGRDGKARLSPAFTEWMVGLPAGWLTDHISRNQAIARAGNGVVPQQAAYALSTLRTFQAAARELTAAREAVAA